MNETRTNNEFETWLSGIESDAAAVLPKLLDNQLSQFIKDHWSVYVASLFRRTPKYRAQISERIVQAFKERAEDPGYIRERQYELLKRGELVFAEDIKKENEELLSYLDGSTSFYNLLGLKRQTALLANALRQKAWYIEKAPPGKSFVMSDSPVSSLEYINGNGRAQPGPGFAKDWTAVFVPLTPQYVFVAISPVQWISVSEPEGVDLVNLLTVRFAYRRVYAHINSSEIQSQVDTEIDQIMFGHNAFLPASSGVKP